MTVIVHQSKPQSIDDLIELAQECLDKLAVLDTMIPMSQQIDRYMSYISDAQTSLRLAMVVFKDDET